MSKTSQRIRSDKHLTKQLYKIGFNDAVTGYGFRWRRHPKINDYRMGFKKGKESITTESTIEPVRKNKYTYYALLAVWVLYAWTQLVITAIDKGWF